MGLFIFKVSPYMPSRTGLGVGTAVLARDTSGSIDQRTIELMGGCMAGIFEQAPPERAYVIDCDACVQQIIELNRPTDIDAAEVSRRARGGGGTMFEPVFDKLEELDIKPDVLVYLTDGYGSYPEQPPGYQVIWAIVPGGTNSCPWGDVVQIEE
jgi:predicted metal-dependent peptidase